MQREVISRDLNVLPLEEIRQFFKGKVEIKGTRVVEIVVCGILVVLVPNDLIC